MYEIVLYLFGYPIFIKFPKVVSMFPEVNDISFYVIIKILKIHLWLNEYKRLRLCTESQTMMKTSQKPRRQRDDVFRKYVQPTEGWINTEGGNERPFLHFSSHTKGHFKCKIVLIFLYIYIYIENNWSVITDNFSGSVY